MTDEDALKLLRLLSLHFDEYVDQPKEMTVADLIDDLAMSMDVTTDEADQIRQEYGN